jgi:16S rRNA (guanine1207-N2)-methyltransferase
MTELFLFQYSRGRVMGKRKKGIEAAEAHDGLAAVADKLRPPVAIVLGSPREVVDIIGRRQISGAVCYQMDLYQADRLRQELAAAGQSAEVVTRPDLWDLPADFATALYPVAHGGERLLKLDMVEQAFHILKARGNMVVSSPYEKDQLFPGILKKIYGRVHAPAEGQGAVFWCRKEEEHPRRRHEVTFQARFDETTSLRFHSRPGVFSHGRFDDGARALVETMRVAPGEAILDAGCGCGTNGIWASKLAGPTGRVAFVDSNVRAVALAEQNAAANGLSAFEAYASSALKISGKHAFDVALANPPYYAQSSIAQLFIEGCHRLLRPGGRFYLVTKQPDQVGPMVAEQFGRTEVVERRGYIVLSAVRK